MHQHAGCVATALKGSEQAGQLLATDDAVPSCRCAIAAETGWQSCEPDMGLMPPIPTSHTPQKLWGHEPAPQAE